MHLLPPSLPLLVFSATVVARLFLAVDGAPVSLSLADSMDATALIMLRRSTIESHTRAEIHPVPYTPPHNASPHNASPHNASHSAANFPVTPGVAPGARTEPQHNEAKQVQSLPTSPASQIHHDNLKNQTQSHNATEGQSHPEAASQQHLNHDQTQETPPAASLAGEKTEPIANNAYTPLPTSSQLAANSPATGSKEFGHVDSSGSNGYGESRTQATIGALGNVLPNVLGSFSGASVGSAIGSDISAGMANEGSGGTNGVDTTGSTGSQLTEKNASGSNSSLDTSGSDMNTNSTASETAPSCTPSTQDSTALSDAPTCTSSADGCSSNNNKQDASLALPTATPSSGSNLAATGCVNDSLQSNGGETNTESMSASIATAASEMPGTGTTPRREISIDFLAVHRFISSCAADLLVF
ncbi:hypothetical protein D9757_011307 [Collybiopsis confluens]|uniref:Uncharacterized protein n=1 Tax=Collybiopsis confluens TaxID=2823264 RepID=A0A8H5GNC5_9AGAR|nr:hypothetical protein D9757_011307 [Collybiopsis confluens]